MEDSQESISIILESNEKLKRELEQWKELFFSLKKDHELLENFQTNDWMVKARELGIDI